MVSPEKLPIGTQIRSHLALYFSASWCGPCQSFSPSLISVYEKLKAKGDKWEVVFVSSDRDQASFDEYFAKMPFLAVPLADKARKSALSRHFDVEGIPTLIQLGPVGADGSREVVNKALRASIMADPEGAEFPWLPKPVQDLAAGAGEINSLSCTAAAAAAAAG